MSFLKGERGFSIKKQFQDERSRYKCAEYRKKVQERLGYIMARYEGVSQHEMQMPVWTQESRDNEISQPHMESDVQWSGGHEGNRLPKPAENDRNKCDHMYEGRRGW